MINKAESRQQTIFVRLCCSCFTEHVFDFVFLNLASCSLQTRGIQSDGHDNKSIANNHNINKDNIIIIIIEMKKNYRMKNYAPTVPHPFGNCNRQVLYGVGTTRAGNNKNLQFYRRRYIVDSRCLWVLRYFGCPARSMIQVRDGTLRRRMWKGPEMPWVRL